MTLDGINNSFAVGSDWPVERKEEPLDLLEMNRFTFPVHGLC